MRGSSVCLSLPSMPRVPMRHMHRNAPPASEHGQLPSQNAMLNMNQNELQRSDAAQEHSHSASEQSTSDDDRMSRLKRTAELIKAQTNPAAHDDRAHDSSASNAQRAHTWRQLHSADPVIVPEVRIASLLILCTLTSHLVLDLLLNLSVHGELSPA